MRRYRILVYKSDQPHATISILENRKLAVQFAEQQVKKLKQGLVVVEEDDGNIIFSVTKGK